MPITCPNNVVLYQLGTLAPLIKELIKVSLPTEQQEVAYQLHDTREVFGPFSRNFLQTNSGSEHGKPAINDPWHPSL